MSNGEAIIPSCTREDVGSRSLFPNKMSWKYVKVGLALLLILGTLAACVAVIYYWEYIERFQNWGYLSAFIFGFIAGSSLPVPLPYLIVTFSLGGLLNPLFIGLASGIGAGIGGALVYLLGSSGSHLLTNILNPHSSQEESSKGLRLYQHLSRWTYYRGSLVIFLMSAIFNPVFAPMAITVGALHFGFRRFLFWCVLGNIVKSTVIAYCGYFGLAFILRWTGG
jgi:membrane protein YqaA with SNARE-associated domain